MTPITCPQCGGISAYYIRPDGLFGCFECGDILDRRDIDLDGCRVWVVDENGILNVIADPVEARKTLHEHLDDYLSEPLDSYWEPSILNAFEWATADVLDAMNAGLRIPEMENNK
ncbi:MULTISPECIES: hypothetical protein [unclassified Streptomyces]|uniref:hypothetical protein n=1 Tax=unclassified Streptomyces TaxID=2593676 RepID=UPI0033D71E2C